MQDALSALPTSIPVEFQEHLLWPPPVAEAAPAVASVVLSAELTSLNALAKELARLQTAEPIPDFEREDEDADEIARLEKSLGSKLKVIRQKARRKRAAQKAKLLIPAAKKAKIAKAAAKPGLVFLMFIFLMPCKIWYQREGRVYMIE